MTANLSKQIIIGLDYEVFFGKNTGSAIKSLIEPTDQIVKVLEKHNAKLSLFVDSGYLLKLQEQANEHPSLRDDLERITDQLKSLSQQGHDIQLHIHPHWEDCHFDGEQWHTDTSRYRLHDFSEDDQIDLVKRYKHVLDQISTQPIFAYRAGGWCMQPFDSIAKALKSQDVWLDSTAYEHGFSEDPIRWFDFRKCPQTPLWKFETDPVKPVESGYFTEIPISAMPINPLFYWISTLRKKLQKPLFKSFGDGATMVANSGYYLTRLTRWTFSPVTLDGAKAGLLENGYRYHQKLGSKAGVFNIMGHPKTLCPYSIIELDKFLAKHQELTSITFQDLKDLRD